MATDKTRLVAYVKPEQAKKLKIIAENEHRTMSKEIEHLIAKNITNYEYEHGEIKIEEE